MGAHQKGSRAQVFLFKMDSMGAGLLKGRIQ